jgi:hypothetical protein
MLVDFLKGNHFDVASATMPWLKGWGLACPCVEGYLCSIVNLRNAERLPQQLLSALTLKGWPSPGQVRL